MADAKTKKDVEDPEEILHRKFRAKCRFRALGRLALANAYWMIEAGDQYEGLDDVKRRVEQAVRGTIKKKRFLTINDKSLLNKPALERTDAEKKHLYRIIGGLKCFKRYPNHVKRKLAAVTYFKYYGPGRTIVREHQEAHALYFVVTGDVVVSQMVFDELLKQHISMDVGFMHPGDLFGEVSLLHNIHRTATVTTTGHCEFLALMKEDFKSVLQASIQKQWDEVRLAMSSFTYFDTLDQVAFREGCIVAKMKSYEINETILGDGVGVPNFVYFVLAGKCQMIESLQVIVKKHLGRDYYTLYDPYVPKEQSELDITRKYLEAQKSPEKVGLSNVSDAAVVNRQTDSANGQMNPTVSKTGTSSLEMPGRATVQSTGFSQEKHSGSIRTEFSVKNISETNDLLKPTELGRNSLRLSLTSETSEELPNNLRTYFMQVCQLNPGSSFGFGENMRDRRIVALKRVDCLLLPKVWLLQRNSANIWTRIQYFLEMKIPNKKQLFKEFVAARRWLEYREQVVSDVVARANTVNSTTIHDVPYSIRTQEMMDI